MSQSILIGWVLAKNDLASRREVEIVDGERVVATGAANHLSESLRDHKIGDGRYGFRIPLPPRLHDGEPHLLHARDRETGARLMGSLPLTLPKRTAGQIIGIAKGRVFGWLPGPCDPPPEIEIGFAGLPVLVQPARVRRDTPPDPATGLHQWSFWLDLESLGQSNPEQLLELRDTSSGLHIGGSPVASPMTLATGNVDRVGGAEIDGWACQADTDTALTTLELWVDGAMQNSFVTREFRADLRRLGVTPSYCGFRTHLPVAFRDGLPHAVDIRFAQTGGLLQSGRFEMTVPPHTPLQQANTHGPAPSDAAKHSPALTATEPPPLASATTPDPTVDIIVPVYRGLEQTLACLHSVLETPDTTPHTIIVINDASPEPMLSEALRQLAAEHPRLTLLENAKNLGFVATVNRGMRLHPERDVILLNADTVAPASDWIARLREHAISTPDIATVTPFSNRATICSLPRCNVDNPLIADHTVSEIDALCAALNPCTQVPIPTAVGSCAYIRRNALNAAGYFNEGAWGRGYAEENEFSIRSAALGWRHVAACDTFIEHHGAVSFQAEKLHLVAQNMARLGDAYPHYLAAVTQFLEDDPLATFRARVVCAILKERAEHRILHVIHGWGGGTQAHALDLCRRLARSGQACLVLKPHQHGGMELSDPADDLGFSMPSSSPLREWADRLQDLGVWHVHIHHVIGLPETIWQLPVLLNCPFDVTIHDYYLACPRINLINAEQKHCGNPTVGECQRCLRAAPLQESVEQHYKNTGEAIVSWRTLHDHKLSGARRVFVPSHDTRRRLLQFFPSASLQIRVQVKPHPEDPFTRVLRLLPTEQALRVAIMGAVGSHKGFALLRDTAHLALSRSLPIRFMVIGYTSDNTAFDDLPNVDILGPYDASELPGLIEMTDCRVALFLSPWPETYSYTLSEAWRAGLVPLSLNMGAPAERIEATGAGVLMPAESSADDVINALMKLRLEGFGPVTVTHSGSDDPARFLQDYYSLPSPPSSDAAIKPAA